MERELCLITPVRLRGKVVHGFGRGERCQGLDVNSFLDSGCSPKTGRPPFQVRMWICFCRISDFGVNHWSPAGTLEVALLVSRLLAFFVLETKGPPRSQARFTASHLSVMSWLGLLGNPGFWNHLES